MGFHDSFEAGASGSPRDSLHHYHHSHYHFTTMILSLSLSFYYNDLIRRGVSYLALGDWPRCESDLVTAARLEPGNRFVNTEWLQ